MKTKSHSTLLFLALGFFIFSCTSEPTEEATNELDSYSQDSIKPKEVDTIADNQVIDTFKKVYENPEVQEAHVAIVKKYGEQWDFCKCIIKSDSVNTALMEASDDEFDKVMERSNYIDNKCKGLLIQPNSTPEDRYKHENKVKKCLASAKK